jgi:SAM-dependent methyltransferase
MRDRTSCLRDFEEYYRSHCGTLAASVRSEATQPGGDGREDIFEEAALLKLYDDYCRASAARLYDCVQRIMPFMNMQSRGPQSLRILDITCFATTQMFRIMFPKAIVHACDKHLRWRAFLDGVECRSCNLEKDSLPYDDDALDLVVFTETLEHVPRSPYTILTDIRRVLKPGGLLLLSVPNLMSLTNRVKMFLGRNVLSVELFYSDSFGHFREYSMDEVRHLFDRVGLERLCDDFVHYDSGLHASGRGLRAVRLGLVRMASSPLLHFFPDLRPVCLVIGRK